ncbi:MAG: acylneuraminate cytidylyltransferase family protein [Pseudohongiella sp.]|nr:acylneuraminate cytidylyltransferase family protein [Pseudohongiella sp.]
MTKSSEILIVIPARGGSKRLPRKNVLPLMGKPLICWTIEQALDANLGAKIIVSSDDDEILEIARKYDFHGVCVHRRNARLATDEASTADVLIDVVNSEFAVGNCPKVLVLLQPTSPLRSSEDICVALQVFKDNGSLNSVVSVCKVDHPTAWVGYVDEHSVFTGAQITNKRSQDYKQEFRLNGAVYVVLVSNLISNRSHFTQKLLASVMPRERSVDIDEDLDFNICERLKEIFSNS